MKRVTSIGLLAILGCGGSVSTTAQGGSGGTSAATTGSGGATQSSTTSATTSTSTSTTTSTSSTTAACDAQSCAAPFVCCGDLCVNAQNDPTHCGDCGKACPASAPYCDEGACGTPPCNTPKLCGAAICCGISCCQAGEICCHVPGSVDSGPACQKPDPQTGTCSKGCPACVCASPDTPIATPSGERAIAELRPGDLVFSVDGEAVRAVPVLRVNRAEARDHVVVRVSLANGRALSISAPHPTADGRTFGELRAGEALDGIAITRVEVVPYAHPATYDILPASSTGTYYAAGALIGTTLPR